MSKAAAYRAVGPVGDRQEAFLPPLPACPPFGDPGRAGNVGHVREARLWVNALVWCWCRPHEQPRRKHCPGSQMSDFDFAASAMRLCMSNRKKHPRHQTCHRLCPPGNPGRDNKPRNPVRAARGTTALVWNFWDLCLMQKGRGVQARGSAYGQIGQVRTSAAVRTGGRGFHSCPLPVPGSGVPDEQDDSVSSGRCRACVMMG